MQSTASFRKQEPESELALIEKADEGNCLGNSTEWAVHTLSVYYTTR